jgi:hypothetical protein
MLLGSSSADLDCDRRRFPWLRDVLSGDRARELLVLALPRAAAGSGTGARAVVLPAAGARDLDRVDRRTCRFYICKYYNEFN